MSKPLIIDTDIGGDPDDAFAIALASRLVQEKFLVITGDEKKGARARYARKFLNCLGREDVVVLEGADLNDAAMYAIDGLAADHSSPPISKDVTGEVAEILETSEEANWVELGPPTNLAKVLQEIPAAREKLSIFLMGGHLNQDLTKKAEHNFRLDPAAAEAVLALSKKLWIVGAHTTFSPELEIVPGDAFYQALTRLEAPWARMLVAHCEQWFERFHNGTIQHDPLTLAAALSLPFVSFSEIRIALSSEGHMFASEDGSVFNVSIGASHKDCLKWIRQTLIPTR